MQMLHMQEIPVFLSHLSYKRERIAKEASPRASSNVSDILDIPTPCNTNLHFIVPLARHYQTLHNTIPPTLLSTHSLLSKIPRSVETYMHSPGLVKPSTYPAFRPLVMISKSVDGTQILLVGFDTNFMRDRTGELLWYFKPSHSRL